MNSWKVILATVVIFGAGVITGGLLVNHINRSNTRIFHRSENRGPRPPDFAMSRFAERMNEQLVQRLDDTLKLTPVQREKITKILADGQEQNRQIWTNVAPKMFAVMVSVNQQICAELAPDQKKPFEELMKQFASHGLHGSHGTNTPPFLPPTNFPPPD